MTVVYTLDHRHGDAAVLLPFLKVIKDLVEDPENFKGENHPVMPSYAELEKRRREKKAL